jgi:hypothetical protein
MPQPPRFRGVFCFTMKTLLRILVASLACHLPSPAAEAPAPQVSLTVKKQVIDSDHDLHGRQGSSAKKVLTLRAEITNISQEPVKSATLTGTALILKAGEVKEMLVRQPLAETPVPELRPGGRITLDVGRIVLHEREWRNRKFEETLEEWQVVCEADGKQLGTAESSSRYAGMEKMATQPGKAGPGNAKRKKKQP